jgi:aspartyl-tRNA(Asn)/glutamyl-tRNA(Gln) amidotransferase subunit A
MEAGQLAEMQFRSCLARRQRLLTSPQAEWARLAVEHQTGTEALLRAWASFDVPAGLPPGAIPLGVKDVIDARGFPTRAGSRSRNESAAADADAEVVRRLRARGIVPVGKTATTEFAYLDPAATTNPFSSAHTPGGSSSGSAAAVGAGVVPLALGTQTAGSVCRPAAFCGTYAFKPGTGATPPPGVVPFAPTFDTVGIFGLDPELVASASLAMLGMERAISPQPRASLAIGVLEDEYYLDISEDCRAAFESACRALRDDGHNLVAVRLGWQFELLRQEHRCVMQHEAWSDHHALLEDEPAPLLGPHWRAALEAGRALDRRRVESARESLTRAKRVALEAIAGLDFVVMPPARSTAPAGIASTGDAGLIVPWTFIGSPLAVLPVGLSGVTGLPTAVMLAGHPGHDPAAILGLRQVADVLRARGLVIDNVAEWPRHRAVLEAA